MKIFIPNKIRIYPTNEHFKYKTLSFLYKINFDLDKYNESIV